MRDTSKRDAFCDYIHLLSNTMEQIQDIEKGAMRAASPKGVAGPAVVRNACLSVVGKGDHNRW
jgi:hypothetical protein